ncbi:MAG: ABC transporter permease [Candidatus Thermoplasmatota archaeon]|nr:ABC transporter permease [Candidatus Thermoplasmatota archaeon]
MNVYLIIRKLVQVVILLVLMAVVLFVIFRLMPGNPVDLFIYGAKTHYATSTEIKIVEARLGLTGGKWNFHNFVVYMVDMFTFNFGYDYFSQATVWQIILNALPYSLLLLGTALALSFVIGLPIGILATWYRGKKKEAVINTSNLILNSIPYFILAILFYLYFVAFYPIFPVNGSFGTYDLYHMYYPAIFVKVLYKMTLPLLSLVLVEEAAHVLTMRAAMVSVMGEDFITTARAKGVAERTIFFRHAARNAMIPVSTRMALEFAFLTSGAIFVEVIFSWPGIGSLIYSAALNEDYPLSEGALFIISLVVILTYSIIDFIHAWLDPRISAS